MVMLVVSIIFGVNFSITKSLLSSELLSPEGLTMARILFACVAFWLVSLFMPRERVPLKDLLMLFVGSMCATTLNQVLFIYGMAKTSPVDASIVVTSPPVIAMILAAFVLKEPITFKKAAGVFVGAAGALLLIATSQYQSDQSSSFVGNLLIFTSGAIYCLYLVVVKPVVERYSAVTTMKWMFLFSLISVAPFMTKSLITAPLFRQTEIQPFLHLFIVVFGATFITYLLIPVAQKLIRPTTISMYNYVQMLVATTVAIIAGQGRLTPEKLLSAALIFVGVYLVTKSKSRQQVLDEQVRLREKEEPDL